jgi:hypothetical protein
MIRGFRKIEHAGVAPPSQHVTRARVDRVDLAGKTECYSAFEAAAPEFAEIVGGPDERC